jgi:hypothetical protein
MSKGICVLLRKRIVVASPLIMQGMVTPHLFDENFIVRGQRAQDYNPVSGGTCKTRISVTLEQT